MYELQEETMSLSESGQTHKRGTSGYTSKGRTDERSIWITVQER